MNALNTPSLPALCLGLTLALGSPSPAADAPAKGATPKPKSEATPKEDAALVPTQANVAYGTHERQVLDFYQAKSTQPTPLLFFIHGGGWVTGDKKNPGSLKQCLAAGISVVSINYGYS